MGNSNSGYLNTGDSNSGDSNSGCYNQGDSNTGDFNLASNCVGCFNTVDQRLKFFDKPSNITLHEWRSSKAYELLSRINLDSFEIVSSENMTKDEKKKHPEYKTLGGYLKTIDNSKCYIKWWKKLTDTDKEIIKSIPNFDSKKFYKITGIDVRRG